MNDASPSHSPEKEKRSPDGGMIGRLIRRAGARAPVPSERAARVKRTVRAAWRSGLRRRARRKRYWTVGSALAAAALVMLSFSLGWWNSGGPPRKPLDVAILEMATGPVRIIPPGKARANVGWRRLKMGESIPAGSKIETDRESRAAFRLSQGGSLRLDGHSRLRFHSARTLILERGAVYVDSGARGARGTEKKAAARPFEIRTALGIARDVGTQFEVRLTGKALRVRVREGTVRLRREGGAKTFDAQAGVELTLKPGGAVTRKPVARNGPAWAWIARVAPPFALEGRTLRAFLDWAAREGGWTLRFSSAASGKATAAARLHGSIEGLTVRQALDAVLPVCALKYRIKDGVLFIHLQDGKGRPER